MFLKRTKSENKTMKSATERSLRNNTKDLGCEESYWCFPEYMWNSPSTYDPLTVLKATQSSVAFCGPSLVPGADLTSFSRGKAQSCGMEVKVESPLCRCHGPWNKLLSFRASVPPLETAVAISKTLSALHCPQACSLGLIPRKTKKAVGDRHKRSVITHIRLPWLVRWHGSLWKCPLECAGAVFIVLQSPKLQTDQFQKLILLNLWDPKILSQRLGSLWHGDVQCHSTPQLLPFNSPAESPVKFEQCIVYAEVKSFQQEMEVNSSLEF